MSESGLGESEGRPAPALPGDEPRAYQVLDRAEEFPLARTGDRWEEFEVREPSLPAIVRTTMPTNVEPEAWFYQIEVREYELPVQLGEDLRERVPQALLRDLHRPVREFAVTPEEIEGTIAPGQSLHRALAEVRAARVVEALPRIEPSLRALKAERQRWRAFLDEPWQPMVPDEAPRKELRSFAIFDDD